MIENLKQGGIFNYLAAVEKLGKNVLSYDLDQKYKNIFQEITSLISKDLEKDNLEQVEIVMDELFKMKVCISARITDRKRRMVEARMRLY